MEGHLEGSLQRDLESVPSKTVERGRREGGGGAVNTRGEESQRKGRWEDRGWQTGSEDLEKSNIARRKGGPEVHAQQEDEGKPDWNSKGEVK